MLRLKSGGRPIMTCLQLYQEANLWELLEQPDAFRQFVHTHCIFGTKERLLEQALSAMDHIGTEANALGLDDVLETKGLSKEHAEEIRKYREEAMALANQQGMNNVWADRIAIVGLLSRIPAEKLSEQLRAQKHVPTVESAKNEAAGGITFGNAHELFLTDDKYTLVYNNTLKLTDGQMIRSYCLIGERPAGTSVSFADMKGEILNCEILKSGECLFVNVVDQTVVCLLPRQIRKGTSVIERGITRALMINGHVIQGTESATAFALDVHAGLDQVIWVKDGCPAGNINDMRIPFLRDVVDVALRGELFYLLRSTGTVISNDVKADGRSFVVSLKAFIGGK